MEEVVAQLTADLTAFDARIAEQHAECERIRALTTALRARVDEATLEAAELRRSAAVASADREVDHRDSAAHTDDLAEVPDEELAARRDQAASDYREKLEKLRTLAERVATLETARDNFRARNAEWLGGINEQIGKAEARASREVASCGYVEERVQWTGLLATYVADLDGVTAEREASFRDVVQDLHAALELSADLDRVMDSQQQTFLTRREEIIRSAHAFAERLHNAFAVDRDVLVAQYRTGCTRNNELRHHLHRGTHNPRSTQMSDKERQAYHRHSELHDEIAHLVDQREALAADLHGFDRKAQSSLEKSAVSDAAFAKSKQLKKRELHETRVLLDTMKREAAQWREARGDLELQLRHARAGAVPDGDVCRYLTSYVARDEPVATAPADTAAAPAQSALPHPQHDDQPSTSFYSATINAEAPPADHGDAAADSDEVSSLSENDEA